MLIRQGNHPLFSFFFILLPILEAICYKVICEYFHFGVMGYFAHTPLRKSTGAHHLKKPRYSFFLGLKKKVSFSIYSFWLRSNAFTLGSIRYQLPVADAANPRWIISGTCINLTRHFLN